MKISYTWIQEEYFSEPLPRPHELVEQITKGAWEVEEIQENGNDYVIDIDVLPNRAHDCLCHWGIAKEIGVLARKKCKEKTYEPIAGDSSLESVISVIVHESQLCPRYISQYIKNITVGPSPEWLKKRVESIGQRSINNIVDIINYVLLEIGQPLHVFDADKLEKSEVHIRLSQDGETISTLDEKNVELDSSMLVIADGSSPVALAGIKGGKKAEVDKHTKNIFIEAANFDQVNIRRTANKTQIKTDASKRYENGITSEMAEWGMNMATQLILDIAGNNNTRIGPKLDQYAEKEKQHIINTSLKMIQNVLGVAISAKEVEEIFDWFRFAYTKNDDIYSIEVPYERLDLRIPEDIAEEVGRVYGYENIEPKLPGDMGFNPEINKMFYYHNKVRSILVSCGCSELQTYVLRNRGEVELMNPFAKDKLFLRSSVYDGLFEALVLNARNIDLLGIDAVKVFEIGTVFTKNGEHVVVGVGYHNPRTKKSKAKEKETLQEVIEILSNELGEQIIGSIKEQQEGGAVVEINLNELVKQLPQPEHYGDILETHPPKTMFKAISPYPFVIRDIAVFVCDKSDQKILETILTDKAGNFLAREPRLFDVFKKESENGTIRISYAYRLIFQSHERTLTNEEVGVIMDTIYNKIKTHKDWELRDK